MKSNFDYETKPSGVGIVKKLPWYIPAIKLKWGLAALKDIPKGGKVLEIGCGGGAMTRGIKFYRPDLEVYGLDPSDLALGLAKENSGGVKFVKGDVFKLKYPDNFFDAVVSFDVLEHLDPLPKALSEIKRVLKKGGIFHSAIPYEGSLWNIEGWLTRFGWKSKVIYCGHVDNFKIGAPEKVIEKAGFKRVWRKFSGYFFYQLFDSVYFTIILVRGKNFPFQVEGFVSSSNSIKAKILKFFKSIVATLFYLESIFLFFLPGLHGHLTYKK